MCHSRRTERVRTTFASGDTDAHISVHLHADDPLAVAGRSAGVCVLFPENLARG
jgi:hypothetical protein